MDNIEKGRAQLVAWQNAKQTNYLQQNLPLQHAIARYLPQAERAATLARLSEFGAAMAGADDLAHRCDQPAHGPVLARYDAIGRRQERVHFDGAYHQIGEMIYGSGVMTLTGQPQRAIEQAALILLAAHNGEAGHVCPLACTAGLIKAIQRVGHPALQAALLPGLLDQRYATRLHGSQFLTEVQGGSDVGANACQATAHTPETAESPAVWRISGEKWFCSVVDAPLYLMTARPQGAPEGTRGLGLFVVPHDWEEVRPLAVKPLPTRPSVSGPRPVNAFRIRRLKNKLGTRAMASGEVDWDGAKAWQLGSIDKGFAQVVEIVLNTSRLFNALACAGGMWRAFAEASSFAQYRQAFGQAIAEFAAVDRAIAQLHVEALAATLSTLDLIALEQDPTELAAWRLGLNMNKYWTSLRNTQMQRLAMEVLGGNGAIEDFSPLPRLYRDAMVTESWEGTHNVLAAQTWRDFKKLHLHQAWLTWIAKRLNAAPTTVATADLLKRHLLLNEEAQRIVEATAEDTPIAVRTWMENAAVLHQALCLAELISWEQLNNCKELPHASLIHWLALHPWKLAVTEKGWWPK